MQRSRRAFRQRRASAETISGRNHLYKVSLSLVFVLWGLLFILSLWISHGDGFRDGSAALGSSTWDDLKMRDAGHFDLENKCILDENHHSSSSDIVDSSGSEISICNNELPSSEENENSNSLEEQPTADKSGLGVKSENVPSKSNSNRLSHSVPLGLDEFKSRAFSPRSKPATGQTGGVIHRLEPAGKEYNYASASKGAKVLAYNKEAKGASNILGKDEDKYLRNPCSAEERYVVIELSEETLVDTITIANFEHHSSNLKEFELHGSLVYPTDEWVKIGNFTASNAKQTQSFVLQEPKWVRYLKLNLLSHYGSEFYCTLSMLEVYGVDAVERMLEDLISDQDKLFVPGEKASDLKQTSLKPDSIQGNDFHQNIEEMEPVSLGESLNAQVDASKSIPDPVEEIRHQQVGRMPGDTVLKVLMQKVRSLDLNLSVLERYLEELNSKYSKILKDFDGDIAAKDKVLEKIRADIIDLLNSRDTIAKDVGNLISWKLFVSQEFDTLRRDKANLRSKVEEVRDNQTAMENKGIVVFLVCIIFGFLAIMRLFIDMLLRFFKKMCLQRTDEPRKFCCIFSSWFLLLFICSLII